MPRPIAEIRRAEFARLLDCARAGDERALEQILAQTETSLRRIVDRRMGRRLRKSIGHSDVLQNSYMTMLESLPEFDGTTRKEFLAWLARIIELDIKRQHRWFSAGKRAWPSGSSQLNHLADELAPDVQTPSAECAGIEEREGVRRAIARLDPSYVEVVELSVFEHLSHREIAERLGKSEGACRMLLMRARAALALELDKIAGDE